MDSDNRNRVKLLAAVIGGSAMVAMGAMTVAIHQEQAVPDVAAKSTSMTLGATTTSTTPVTVEATTMAVPAIKGPAPLPSEEKSAE
jgi:homoserine acetyltransferase